MISKKDRCSMMSGSYLIPLFLCALMVAGVTGESMGASEEDRVAKLIEGAKSEGKMVFYTVQTVTDSSQMIRRFEEKYPFIKAELYRAPSTTLLTKIVNEAKARKYIPDVIENTGFHTFLLKKERLTTSYVSPESRAFPEGFKDPEGNWTSTYVLPFIIGYNANLVSRKDIPDTYEGFLNPRWKGRKIGFDNQEVAEWFANMLKIMGEAKGLDFFRKLVAQELNYRKGHSLICDLMIAGEFPVGTVYPHTVETRKKRGAKVDWVGVAPVIAKFGAIGLATHAPHPHAGQLFIDFCLSKEGQTMLGNTGRIPARPDVDVEILNLFKGMKIYPSDVSLADKFTAYNRQGAALFR